MRNFELSNVLKESIEYVMKDDLQKALTKNYIHSKSLIILISNN